MTTHTPQQASDFENIYYPDGTCTVFDGTADCRKPGVVLAYDVFSPEVGMWFCREHWAEYWGQVEIVVDKRHTLPALIEQYRATATILARQPDTLPRLLAADYRFVAELLVLALRRGTVAMLVRELRGNLNRRASYIHSGKRNKTLQVAAKTIERLETKSVYIGKTLPEEAKP